MIKRDDYDEEINHDRWLISYSDFMTLLLAFFVVLYSVSQVSEKKYKQLSDTLSAVFNPTFLTDDQAEKPSQITSESDVLALDDQESQYAKTQGTTDDEQEAQQKNKEFQEITDQLQESFASLIDSDLISVSGDEQWLQIEMQSAILFESGGAQLNEAATLILSELTEALNQHNNVIRVEGFTDNIPIKTSQFQSNWELSTARSIAVVRLMETQGIDASRMAAVGYGEHQPVADNSTADGRARNRRIVLMVSTSESLRPDVHSVETIVIDDDAVVIDLNDEAAVSQFELSAREQAEAWFKRMNAIVDNSPSLEAEVRERAAGSNIVGAVSELPEAGVPDSSDVSGDISTPAGEQDDAVQTPAPAEPAEGIRRIELEDGSVLFTNDA